MTTCLEKSCSFGLPRVPFVNCCQFMNLVISLLVWGQDVGSDCISSWSLLIFLLRLYRFLIIAFSSTLFRLALWPSAGKELSHWLSTPIVFILCRLSCMCSFPVWCLGLDVLFDSIGSWSLLFSTLFIHWSLFDKISKDLKLYMFPKTLTEICKIGWKISCKNAF